MRVLFLIFAIFSMLSACSTNQGIGKKPQDLIPKDSIVRILKDLTLIESYIQDKYNHVQVFKETMILSGNKIMRDYHVSYDRFERSMDYYASRQLEMCSIYAQVLDSLNKDASGISKEVFSSDDHSLNRLPFGMDRDRK